MVLRMNIQQVNPHCLNAKCHTVLRVFLHVTWQDAGMTCNAALTLLTVLLPSSLKVLRDIGVTGGFLLGSHPSTLQRALPAGWTYPVP